MDRGRRGKPIGDYRHISERAIKAFGPGPEPRMPEPGNGMDESRRYGGASAGMLSAISGRLGLIERQIQGIKEMVDRMENRHAGMQAAWEKLMALERERSSDFEESMKNMTKAIVNMTEAVGLLGSEREKIEFD